MIREKSEASRRNLRFHAGVLENAGLGEAAYFLKKARTFISYAQYALEHMDPGGHIDAGNAKIGEVVEKIAEALAELESGERALVLEKEQADFLPPEE